ncbi:2-octaprenyl-6-methoxyphenol hydroxylase [Vibrio xiamenensis]|uniref:2-octaprenyl-6-methoxyphenol hydroxylase n=1 Tax=Vibrio xiamenensis TaxID=861298 RepID=A0A1G7VWD1_9VIBR|nr:2-octaprenyl-6-methoxyphenyl hydroxylase [Vibrio xiamenensis]SDG64072.1 2-octaprenyl-6-methoxyphenol hydroxylase [Vibrio xiamenensis]
MDKFDIVIAGGAMAGMTLALAIQHRCQTSLSIAIVEPFETNHQAHPGFDSRSIALSYGTVQLLKNFDLWQDIAPVATPINDIHVSDRSHLGITEISAAEVGVLALGYVVELADVGRIFAQKIAQSANIELICPDSVADIERSQDEVTIRLQSGRQIGSSLLVAADGAVSTCCEKIGLEMHEHDFEQVAVISNVVTDKPHQGRAYERFTEQGPIALLPMSEGRMSLVWCLPPEQAKAVKSMPDEQFIEHLQQRFGWRLGKIEKVGQRASYPLILRYRPQNISHRFAIVGNAAQTLHPIAGQGFNLGIRDVASLAQEIADSQGDPGSYVMLNRFRLRREQDRQATITLTSALVHVFSNDYLSLRIGRNLGLMAMNGISAVKAPLLQRTLGLVER